MEYFLWMRDEVCNHLHTKEDVFLVDPPQPRNTKEMYLEMLTREVAWLARTRRTRPSPLKQVALSVLCRLGHRHSARP